MYSTLNSTRLTVIEFGGSYPHDSHTRRTHFGSYTVLCVPTVLFNVSLSAYLLAPCVWCWCVVGASKIHSSVNLSRFDTQEEGEEELELTDIDIDTIDSHIQERYDSTSSNSSSEMADAGTPLITHGERLLSSSSSLAAAAGDGYPTPLEYRTAGSATSPPERGSGRDTHIQDTGE